MSQIGSFDSKRWGKVIAYRDSYAFDNTLAVTLVSWNKEDEFYEPLTTLSVHLDASESLPKDHFYVKMWSENEVIAQEALTSGLFEVATEFPPAVGGFVVAPVWRIKA